MRLTGSEFVNCKVVGRRDDQYIAECNVGGMDLGAAMVAAGWALAFPQSTGRTCGAYQEGAKLGGFGRWEGKFTLRSEWRAR